MYLLFQLKKEMSKTPFLKTNFLAKIISFFIGNFFIENFFSISVTVIFLILQLFAVGCGMVSQSKSMADIESIQAELSPTPGATAPVITGLFNDSAPKSAKTWSWGCNDEGSLNTCTFRFAIDQSSAASDGTIWSSYGSTTSYTLGPTDITYCAGTCNGTYYLHVQAKDTRGNTTNSAVAGALGGHYFAILDNSQRAPTGVALSGVTNPGSSTTPITQVDGVEIGAFVSIYT